ARSPGYDVNVTHALEIPVNCGLVAPPIELCDMQGLVLPPYEPSSPQPPAGKPTAQSPVAAPSLPQAPMPSSQPSFTSPPPMPSPLPPTSHGAPGAAVGTCIVAFAVTVALLALIS
uniref:Bifunctional inhibitor/plant lipid transfer protein/seed storage helical domain-containing protein n=1 Tax=Oryza brachyantha TaxID=4533 RepID=J3N969_ORYBR